MFHKIVSFTLKQNHVATHDAIVQTLRLHGLVTVGFRTAARAALHELAALLVEVGAAAALAAAVSKRYRLHSEALAEVVVLHLHLGEVAHLRQYGACVCLCVCVFVCLCVCSLHSR